MNLEGINLSSESGVNIYDWLSIKDHMAFIINKANYKIYIFQRSIQENNYKMFMHQYKTLHNTNINVRL